MKTFDYEQVHAILSPLKAKFDDCAHGEGNECETLDKHLECCAKICFEVADAVTEWAHDVFSGEVVFDPDAETAWRTEVKQIYTQAIKAWHLGRKSEVPCYELPGQNLLASALWQLQCLLNNWVSPKQSVSPSARVKLTLNEEHHASIQKQLADLPPLSRVGAKR